MSAKLKVEEPHRCKGTRLAVIHDAKHERDMLYESARLEESTASRRSGDQINIAKEMLEQARFSATERK